MEKINLLIIFGGKSNEHEISCKSALSILQNIDNNKYKIYIVWINKNNKWFLLKNIIEVKQIIKQKYITDNNECYITINYKKNGLVYNNTFHQIDCIFPVIHGKYGEDGIIQGLFELSKIPYVGCDVHSSSICMNKNISKLILSKNKISIAKYILCQKDNFIVNKKFLNQINKIKFPAFIKPTCSGSSIGVTKTFEINDCINKIKSMFNLYNEIIVEEYIIGSEIEIGILGNKNIRVSEVGEIKYNSDFYDYKTKYVNNKSDIYIPALIPVNIKLKCQKIAKKIFQILNCKGIARIDFFVDENNKIIFNEINTMPGFTNNSMYAKLFEYIGINYQSLIDTLILLCLEKKYE